MTHDELNLINLARQGDRAAYGRLVGAYQGLVFAVALNVTGHWGDSEDAVQEAFLRAWLALRSLADPARFAAWLCAITRNAALEILRRNRRLPLADLEESPARELPADTATPAEAYARRQLAELLWAEVAELPARTREAILLFYVEEYSIRRAAEFLGISEAAFKMRLQYGRERLRETLSTKLAEELHRRKPGENRRQTIVAALPLLPALAALPGAGGGGSGLAGLLAAWSAKQVTVMIGATLLAGAALTGAIYYNLHAHTKRPVINTTLAQARPVPVRATPTPTPETTPAVHAAQPTPSPTPAPAASYPLRGRLLFFESGDTIGGVTPVLDEGRPTEQRARINAQGGWEFPRVTTGRHMLHFRDEECGDRFLRPEGGITLDLWIDCPIDDLRVFVHPPSGVGGRVLDEEGRPIAGARIAPTNLRNTTEALALSDARGYYRITKPHFAPATIRYLQCEAAGYFTAQSSDQAQTFYGHVFEGMDFKLVSRARGGMMAGRVVNQQGHPVPLLPLKLSAVNHSGNQRSIIYSDDQMADAEGRFRFEGVPPGVARIEVERAGSRLLAFAEQTLSPGGKVEALEIRVNRQLGPAAISGRLVKPDGTPAGGETFYVERPKPPDFSDYGANSTEQLHGPILGSTRTAPDGSFLIPGLPAGERLDLLLGNRNFSESYWPDTVMRALRAPLKGVQVPYPKRPVVTGMSSLTETFPQDTGKRPGRIFEAVGWVEMYTRESMMYNVLALASAPCLGTSGNGYVCIGKEMARSQTILEGVVVDDSDAPVAGAELRLDVDRTRSNSRGEFALRRMISETILTVIPPEGYREASLPPTLPPPQRPGEDVVIRNLKIVLERGDPRRPGSITGAVINAQGHPSVNVSVRLTPISTPRGGNRANTYAHTDKEGLFTFKDVPSGKYQIVAGTDRKEITVQEGKATAVILQGNSGKQ